MTQGDRDRLMTLKKAKKKLITQREAATELGVSIRQVKRLLKELKKRGDRAVVHGLRGKPSNRKIGFKTQQKVVAILSHDVYRGFGPTLACEHLGKKHGIHVSRKTIRTWMKESSLWEESGGERKRRICGVHGAAGMGNWCSGIPANTTGWRDEAASSCT